MKVTALAGGVGGAKLADGLARVLPVDDLTVIVNTGDDFEHLGLAICPDLDTVCYTLAGMANLETGWGQAGETWSVLAAVSRLGGPDWFRLGDRDLGTHLERTRRLRLGEPLSQVTREFCQAWGVPVRVLPMTDQNVMTYVSTEAGELPFQEYFVHQHCEPVITGFRFDNIASAVPAPEVLEALDSADVVIFCPSNPWVSIGPILAVPGIKAILASRPVVAVSPIIGGQAVKGPAAKMYHELGITPSALAVASQYRDLLSGFVLDNVDRLQGEEISGWGIISYVTDTLMSTVEDRRRLAEQILEFCARWSATPLRTSLAPARATAPMGGGSQSLKGNRVSTIDGEAF
jgi:LPPG:FO 2-phospho-L-lactate transferase